MYFWILYTLLFKPRMADSKKTVCLRTYQNHNSFFRNFKFLCFILGNVDRLFGTRKARYSVWIYGNYYYKISGYLSFNSSENAGRNASPPCTKLKLSEIRECQLFHNKKWFLCEMISFVSIDKVGRLVLSVLAKSTD